jgi:regulation of enolase protein 1 (concanavalin A-like superfamily)
MSALVVPGLPSPLRPINEPAAEILDDGLRLPAPGQTDWFVDPAGEVVVDNAPALVMSTEGDWMMSALVSVTHVATFDAAVLVVHADEHTWAKLCLERSPGGQTLVVSVVTRGFSDDCNSIPVDDEEMWLRVSRLGQAFAFHASADGRRWDMIRYFGLGTAEPVEVGFLSQSPTGNGCVATFRDISYVGKRLTDVRSGV